VTDRLGSVLRQLRGGVLPVLDQENEQARRERIAARVLELSRELETKRERRRRLGLGMAIAALVGVAAFLLYVGVPGRFGAPPPLAGVSAELRLVGGHVSVRSAEGVSAMAEGQLALPSGAVLVTRAEESAELRLASETALSVAPASEVGVSRRQAVADGFEERVLLRAGGVALRVPKLGTRGKVSVETRDALVEVHGTQFSVRVVERPPLAPFTEVSVREGRVLVRSGAEPRFLGAGERWSSAVDLPSLPAPSVSRPPEPEPALTSAPHERRVRQAGRAINPSELAAQNRLLEAAELARKQSMPDLALSRLDTLIARYPDAELAHNARVERFRVLHVMGRNAEAVAAARDYLRRHPRGFARAEAQHLIEERPASP
jgi:hypothetical protein